MFSHTHGAGCHCGGWGGALAVLPPQTSPERRSLPLGAAPPPPLVVPPESECLCFACSLTDVRAEGRVQTERQASGTPGSSGKKLL